MRRHLPIVVALLLCASALFLDFYNDDWLVRAVLRGRAPGSDPHPLRLYEFMTSESQVRAYVRAGMLPWWTDPLLKIRFFRPLSSLLMWVDHRVLVTPLLGHVHSLLWFVLHLFVARRVIDRVLAPRAARWAFWTLCLAGRGGGVRRAPAARRAGEGGRDAGVTLPAGNIAGNASDPTRQFAGC